MTNPLNPNAALETPNKVIATDSSGVNNLGAIFAKSFNAVTITDGSTLALLKITPMATLSSGLANTKSIYLDSFSAQATATKPVRLDIMKNAVLSTLANVTLDNTNSIALTSNIATTTISTSTTVLKSFFIDGPANIKLNEIEDIIYKQGLKASVAAGVADSFTLAFTALRGDTSLVGALNWREK
jgi:hypothetical protein